MERFSKAQENIEEVAKEIFGLLGISDEEFISKNQLNTDASMQRWEKFLTQTRVKQSESRAKKHVEAMIGDK